MNTSASPVPVVLPSAAPGTQDVNVVDVSGEALGFADYWREAMYLGFGLCVFLLTGVVIRLFPRKKLPL